MTVVDVHNDGNDSIRQHGSAVYVGIAVVVCNAMQTKRSSITV